MTKKIKRLKSNYVIPVIYGFVDFAPKLSFLSTYDVHSFDISFMGDLNQK